MKNIMSLEVSETILTNYNPKKVVEYSTTLFNRMDKVLSGESQREEFFIPTSAICIASILTQFGLEVEEPKRERETYHAVMNRDKSIHILFTEGVKGTDIRICTDSWLDHRETQLAYFAFKAKMNFEASKASEE